MKSAFQKLLIFMFSVLCMVLGCSITADAADSEQTYNGTIYDYMYINDSGSGVVSKIHYRMTYKCNFVPDIFIYSDSTSPDVYKYQFVLDTSKNPADLSSYLVSYTISQETFFTDGRPSELSERSDTAKYSPDISVSKEGVSYIRFMGGASLKKEYFNPDFPAFSSVPPISSDIFADCDKRYDATCYLYYVYIVKGGINGGGADAPDYSDDLAVPDKSLGYLQNVIYKEENRALDGRYATLSWRVDKTDWGSDYRIQIMADNFYTKWFNKTTTEYAPYKLYGDNVAYSSGELTFFSQEPVRQWMDENGYDYKNPLKYQTYGTTNYYVRVVKYDKTDGKYHCGGWVKIDVKRANSNQLPWTETETGGFDDETGGWVTDEESDDSYKYQTGGDGTITVPWNTGNLDDINLNAFTWLWRNIKNMIDGMGQFPAFVTAMFGFLPSFVITAIAGVLVVVILLRFLGR